MGKEWTTAAGAFESYDPMYIKTIATNGEIQHINWVTNYKLIRSALEIEWPGNYFLKGAILQIASYKKFYVTN